MLTIHVCVGSSCHLKGAYNIINKLQALISDRGLEDKLTVKAALCLGGCNGAVSVKLEDQDTVYAVNDKNLADFFEQSVVGLLKEQGCF